MEETQSQEEEPPAYQTILLEDHLKSSKVFPNLYPPDLLDAITSLILNPTLPPEHPHRTYHTVLRKSYSDGAGDYYGELDPKLRRNGYGHMVYDNGDLYHGFWKKNLKNGMGSFFWAETGSVFMGHWQAGERNGRGDFVFGPLRNDCCRVEVPTQRCIMTGTWQKGRIKQTNFDDHSNKGNKKLVRRFGSNLIFVNEGDEEAKRLLVDSNTRIL